MTADDTVGRSGETLRQSDWRDELLKTGIRGKGGQFIRFARLETLPGCRYLHADGESRPNDDGADRIREDGPARSAQRIVVSFGPEHAPLEQRQVEWAIQEAQTAGAAAAGVVFAAFQFDPEASKDIDETNWPGLTLLKAQMNADLLTEDLKRKRASNESFWLIGQPDVYLHHISRGQDTGKWQVEVRGFDYYNTKTGDVESGGEDKDCRLVAGYRLRRAQPLPPAGVLPHVRRQRRLVPPGPQPQGRDRRGPDRSLSRRGVAAVRGRRTPAHSRQDRR